MHFPTHIERLPRTERAGARLRFIVQHAMLQAWNTVSIKKLANLAGYDHSSVASAFKRGYMSEPMALAFERAIGRRHLRSEELMDPLSIVRTKNDE